MSPSILSLRLLAYPSSPIAASPQIAPECDLSNRLNGTVDERQISPKSLSTCSMLLMDGRRCRRRKQLSQGALTARFKDLYRNLLLRNWEGYPHRQESANNTPFGIVIKARWETKPISMTACELLSILPDVNVSFGFNLPKPQPTSRDSLPAPRRVTRLQNSQVIRTAIQ